MSVSDRRSVIENEIGTIPAQIVYTLGQALGVFPAISCTEGCPEKVLQGTLQAMDWNEAGEGTGRESGGAESMRGLFSKLSPPLHSPF